MVPFTTFFRTNFLLSVPLSLVSTPSTTINIYHYLSSPTITYHHLPLPIITNHLSTIINDLQQPSTTPSSYQQPRTAAAARRSSSRLRRGTRKPGALGWAKAISDAEQSHTTVDRRLDSDGSKPRRKTLGRRMGITTAANEDSRPGPRCCSRGWLAFLSYL